MAYRKYYTLETADGVQLLCCDAADNSDALTVLQNERSSGTNNIPANALIYSYDVDETAPDGQTVINKTLIV